VAEEFVAKYTSLGKRGKARQMTASASFQADFKRRAVLRGSRYMQSMPCWGNAILK
jgi:hypothetical protein